MSDQSAHTNTNEEKKKALDVLVADVAINCTHVFMSKGLLLDLKLSHTLPTKSANSANEPSSQRGFVR